MLAWRWPYLSWTSSTARQVFLQGRSGYKRVSAAGQSRFTLPQLLCVDSLSTNMQRAASSCYSNCFRRQDGFIAGSTVLADSAGYYHTCAVRSDGQLICFGDSGPGCCDVPADLGPVLAVSAGDYHTCAVRSDGRLVCFGDNEHGQCDVPADLRPV